MVKNPFNPIIQDFNGRFKTKYSLNNIDNMIKTLKLESLGTVDSALISLSFSYFRDQKFSLTKSYPIDDYVSAKKCISLIFKKPKPIFYENSDVIISIRTKFRHSYNPIGKGVVACTKNDLAIYDIHKKRFFCDSQTVLDEFKNIARKNKINKGSILIHKVSKNLLRKILESKKLKIYEIEFHNIPEPNIPDFYFKAGSRKKPINQKIKEIVRKITTNRNIFAFNIKSLLVSEIGFPKKKERLRISIRPEGPRKYQILVQTKKPSLDLQEKIILVFKEIGIEFDKELEFDDEPFEDGIFQLIRKKQILDYNEYKESVEEWDVNNFLLFRNKKLNVLDSKILEYIKIITKDKFNFEELEQPIEEIKIKGYSLTRKSDKKRIFLFLNKGGNVDEKRMTRLTADKRIPFVSIKIKNNDISYLQEIPFSYLNEKSSSDFIKFLNDILDNPHLYENLKKNFDSSLKDLNSVRRSLSKIKKVNVKGDKWERICSNILNFTFNDTFPLGRSYLPDGITYFSCDEKLLWDAKALLGKNSYFKQSVKGKNKGSIKDTFYIQAFKKLGHKFDHYIYLGIGVTKKEFEDVKNKIEKYLVAKGISVKIVFITEKWLESLANSFAKGDVSRLHKNLNEVVSSIKKEFDKGYLDSFELDFKEIGKKDLVDTEIIRKEVKKIGEMQNL